MPPQCQDILRGNAPYTPEMPAARQDTTRHLPTLPKASTHALNGICPHNQTHIPPGKSPSSATEISKMKARLDQLVSMLVDFESLSMIDLSSSAIDVLETELSQ